MQAQEGAWDYLALDEYLTSTALLSAATRWRLLVCATSGSRGHVAYLRSISSNSVALPAPLPKQRLPWLKAKAPGDGEAGPSQLILKSALKQNGVHA